MPEYADIYVVSDKRNSETITGFLNHFSPEREESADEYEVPQYSDSPDVIYKTAMELVKYCTENSNTEHAIYWRALNNRKPEHAMVFFLKDGHVIYGLSTDASNQEFAKRLLVDLKSYLGTNLGYIAHEASPDANNIEEFKFQMAKHEPYQMAKYEP